MRSYIRCGLIGLISLFPVVGSADSETIHVNGKDIRYFQAIDDGLSAVMSAASECRSSADTSLYGCLCSESTAIHKLESALSSALDYEPAWEGKILYYDGVNLNIPSLEKQVDDVQNQCGV